MYFNEYYIAAFLAVMIAVFSNILLKKGAVGKSKNFTEMVNIFSFFGFTFFFISTLLSLYALRVVKLHEMAYISPLVYIFTPLLSFYFFGEKLTKNIFRGMTFIVIGIIIFNLDAWKMVTNPPRR